MARWICVCLLTLLAACSLKLSPEHDAPISGAFEDLRAGRYEQLLARLDPTMVTPDAPQALAMMGDMVPDEEIVSRRTIHVFTEMNSQTGETFRAVDEYKFKSALVTVETVLIKRDGQWVLAGMQVTPNDPDAVKANAFTFENKPAANFVYLAAQIAVLALMIFAFVRVLMTKGLKLKWLWCVVALLGWGTFAMNWTTSEWVFNPLSVQIVGWGIIRGASELAPWMLKFTLPVGALVSLWIAQRARKRGNT